MTITLLSLALLGMVVGFFAGLFGIGGGAILVPALSAWLLIQGVSPTVAAHMALATSMSCIIFNALLSIRTHQQHQAILWPVVRLMTPTVLFGSLLATYGVLFLTAASVALLFFVLMMLVGLRMLLGTHDADSPSSTTVPVLSGSIAGLIIGAVSALIAIGGGSLSVPYMTWYGIRIQQAIGTAAALGLPIALASTVVFSGQVTEAFDSANMPEQRLGLVYWPATVMLTAGSVITTPLGARLTHRLPVGLLKKTFAVVLMLLAWNMYRSFN
jgi:uncharacterized membrane protein YfcA